VIGALLLGLVAGLIGRALVPHDVLEGMRGPASWLASIVLGLVGAAVGWLIFTAGLGIGDTDVFDWGGILQRADRRGHRAAGGGLRGAPRGRRARPRNGLTPHRHTRICKCAARRPRACSAPTSRSKARRAARHRSKTCASEALAGRLAARSRPPG
jgi:uncharacterized membrane protein YeaQ/YmgE (transglycosylase-associated protein family)